MLNAFLAALALVVWSSSYGLFFQRDLRRWWLGRHERRARQAAERERAVEAYASWIRNFPPPPVAQPYTPPAYAAMPDPPPPPPPKAAPGGRKGGEVVPFPPGGRAGMTRG